MLRENGAAIAVIEPVRKRRLKGNVVTPEMIAASLAAAGARKDVVDTKHLKADLDAARGDASPPVKFE